MAQKSKPLPNNINKSYENLLQKQDFESNSSVKEAQEHFKLVLIMLFVT